MQSMHHHTQQPGQSSGSPAAGGSNHLAPPLPPPHHQYHSHQRAPQPALTSTTFAQQEGTPIAYHSAYPYLSHGMGPPLNPPTYFAGPGQPNSHALPASTPRLPPASSFYPLAPGGSSRRTPTLPPPADLARVPGAEGESSLSGAVGGWNQGSHPHPSSSGMPMAPIYSHNRSTERESAMTFA
jgi:hypothetical protein